MGSSQNEYEYGMNVKIIGPNTKKFYEIIKKSKALKTIKKYWTIKYEEGETIKNLDIYFNELEKNKSDENKTKIIKETLIVKVNSINDNEVNEIIKRMDKLEETHYMPLVLLLIVNYNDDANIVIDKTEYEDIDPRLIFKAKYSEDPLIIEQNIEPKLLRICSIHNELGDEIIINGKENYDLIDEYFPFYINIACIGRFGQGKSTGVNEILQEYKAKESSKGSSQTKNLTYYQVSGKPVRVLDIPGFESKETVESAVRKFQEAKETITKMKNNIHIILYFFNFYEDRKFGDDEIPIIEEIVNHKSSKIIYVITHSNPNASNKQKKKSIIQINEGIQNKTKNNSKVFQETQEGGMLKASEENVVFVNFHLDKKTNSQEFGKKELFKKIHDF